jgi:hypothetical protein
MNAVAEYDFSNLTAKLSELTGALLGRGATPGQAQQVLLTEAGQLAGRIGDALGPKTLGKAKANIDIDINKQMTSEPPYSYFEESQTKSSYDDFTWLYSSPAQLVGIKGSDNRPDLSGEEAVAAFREGQAAGKRGHMYVELGRRGRQRVLRLNRIRISSEAKAFIRQNIINATGELRAAFYRVAVKYVPSKRVPGWIMDKFDQVVAKEKSSDRTGDLDTPLAFIEFTVNAPGVTSNTSISGKISRALQGSQTILQSKLQKILRGFSYDWQTGRIFNSHITEDEDE